MKDLEKNELKKVEGGSVLAAVGAAVSIAAGVLTGAVIAAAVVVGTYYLVKALV
ncbi:hypothetical protein [Prolixibacter sp. SD074]|jgi:hypothetical protein|uniref:hypothetical protein n=1 Tax=Prolixibacter sp. SD074 TaxID=2652391 RepID=UPI00126CE902|nr:hypothetical protein [Prolixibacter sp. SD074]GET30043.1 hypothetical protein SD074_22450 [Prolixibacter sp. SD074]